MSEQTAEIIRQTVAKMTALGEYGRSCATILNNDQNQMRDIGDKMREVDLRVDGLSVDVAQLRRSKTATDPDVVKLVRQTQLLQLRRKELTDEAAKLNTDIGTQQKCINDAKALLADIVKNPSQPLQAPQKKESK